MRKEVSKVIRNERENKVEFLPWYIAMILSKLQKITDKKFTFAKK